MSMTKEEIIKKYEMVVEGGELVAPFMGEDGKEVYEMLKAGLSALRPITRERLEKVWRGEWISYLDGEHIMPERYYSCSKCGGRGHLSKKNFCDFCGAPMTDEAVDMVMERLEELYNA